MEVPKDDVRIMWGGSNPGAGRWRSRRVWGGEIILGGGGGGGLAVIPRLPFFSSNSKYICQ